MMKLLSALLLVHLSFGVSTYAQEPVTLSLAEALRVTMENNSQIVMAQLAERRADASFKQTRAAFLPQISLSYAALSTNNPLNAFGFKLQQQTISPSDFNPDLLNNPSATQNFMAKASWLQPIVNVDRVYQARAAAEQREIYSYMTTRTKDLLAFEVKKAYSQLQLAQQAVGVMEDAMSSISGVYRATESRFEKGFLQKSDVLTVQVQVTTTEGHLAEANSRLQDAADYLSLLMGRQAGTSYRAQNGIQLFPQEEPAKELPDNRADFQALQSSVTAHDHMIQASKMSYLPNLNGFADYLLNDNTAFGFGSDSYLVGAQLSWRLFNGMATRNKITEQRIEREKVMEQIKYQQAQGRIELRKTWRQITDAEISIRQQELAVEQASEALRIIQNRYGQGLVTTQDVLQSHTLLQQQKLKQAEVIFQYNTTHAYLQLLTATSDQ